MFVMVAASALAACGDDLCNANEDPDTCPQDCQMPLTVYLKCLIGDCPYENGAVHTMNVIIVAFIVGLIAFLKFKRII